MQKNMTNNVVDYYKILQVTHRANGEELKMTYGKLAMKEAYDVLAHSVKRQSYCDIGQTSHVNKSCYNNKKANNKASTTTTTRKRKASNSGSDAPLKYQKVVLENRNEHKLVFSLGDLYKGAKRTLKIERKVLDGKTGNMIVVNEILKIKVEAGCKKDTKLRYVEKGNQQLGRPRPDDLVFVVKEKPHEIFKREGDNLIVTQKISLFSALTGKTIKITTLDGREIYVSLTNIVKPDTKIVIENEGMPSTSKAGQKGNLIIKFDIIFPSSLRLTGSQKRELKKIFANNKAYV